MTARTPPLDLLNSLLTLDPEAGELFWKPRTGEMFNPPVAPGRAAWWNARYAGKRAFTAVDGKGYRVGAINSVNFFAHRIIYAIHHGVWPSEIDHINGDRQDNRIENLRAADRSTNSKNLSRPTTNKTGIVGVHFSASRNRWIATIGSGKRQRSQSFLTKREAVAARKAWLREFGYHPNHGRTPRAEKMETECAGH